MAKHEFLLIMISNIDPRYLRSCESSKCDPEEEALLRKESGIGSSGLSSVLLQARKAVSSRVSRRKIELVSGRERPRQNG
jgi:hypothetical protein